MNAHVSIEVGYNLHKCIYRWCGRYEVWLWVCCEYDMNRIMMLKVLMKANVSTDGVYNIRCGCGCVGKDRRGYSDISPLHATKKQWYYQILILNSNKSDINYFYWVQPQNKTYDRYIPKLNSKLQFCFHQTTQIMVLYDFDLFHTYSML